MEQKVVEGCSLLRKLWTRRCKRTDMLLKIVEQIRSQVLFSRARGKEP